MPRKKKDTFLNSAQELTELAEFKEKQRKTAKIFPEVNFIYSAVREFGEDTYNRVIMAYKAPELTKLLAHYFRDFLEDYELTGKDIVSYYVGIGDTNKIRNQCPKIDTSSKKSAVPGYRMGPNGVHPDILAHYAGKGVAYFKSHFLPHQLNMVFGYNSSNNVCNLVEAYIKGDSQAMFKALPANIRIKYFNDSFREYNIPDGISADDLHRIGKWLTEIRRVSSANDSLQRIPFVHARQQVGQWLQETFPTKEELLQNQSVLSAIKAAKKHNR